MAWVEGADKLSQWDKPGAPMTDLETKLLACEMEPSVELLSYTADEYLSAGDEDMYRALSYMAENRKFPWKTTIGYSWWDRDAYGIYCHTPGFSENLPFRVGNDKRVFEEKYNFATAVRWLGRRLIELGLGN